MHIWRAMAWLVETKRVWIHVIGIVAVKEAHCVKLCEYKKFDVDGLWDSIEVDEKHGGYTEKERSNWKEQKVAAT